MYFFFEDLSVVVFPCNANAGRLYLLAVGGKGKHYLLCVISILDRCVGGVEALVPKEFELHFFGLGVYRQYHLKDALLDFFFHLTAVKGSFPEESFFPVGFEFESTRSVEKVDQVGAQSVDCRLEEGMIRQRVIGYVVLVYVSLEI